MKPPQTPLVGLRPVSLDNMPLSWLRVLCPSETIAAANFVDGLLLSNPRLKGSEDETIFVFGYINKTLDLRHVELYSSIFHNARNKLQSAQSAGEMTICLMALVCFVRLYPPPVSHIPLNESFIIEFDRFFIQGYTDTMVATLEQLLTSLHRVLVAEDFSKRDSDLGNLITRIQLRHTLLRFSDPYSDLYWGDRLSEPMPHEVAFANLCYVVNYPLGAPNRAFVSTPPADEQPHGSRMVDQATSSEDAHIEITQTDQGPDNVK